MIRVGFFCHGAWPWARQTPQHDGVFGSCQFIFNGEGPFDYVVVYDGLTDPLSLPLPKARTLFVCSEPMNVKRYMPGFVSQFGCLISADPELKHPNKTSLQAGLPWHYGIKTAQPEAHGEALRYADMLTAPQGKDKILSVICSNKNFTPEHRRRLEFVQALSRLMGHKLDVYGRGFREIDDKAEALASYKYHVALENCDFTDYWTEKIADSFLGGCFPFYWGSKNLESYYPAGSFIRVDLDDPEGSARIIAKAIDDSTFEKRQSELAEARRLTLERHNLFAILAREVEAIEATKPAKTGHVRLEKEQHFYPKPAVTRARLADIIRRWPWLFKLLKSIYYGRKTWPSQLYVWGYKKGSRLKHWFKYITNTFYRDHQHWLAAKGEEIIRFDYKLDANSIVFDVGGFEGHWGSEINRRSGARVYIFEPVKSFIEGISTRILGNERMQLLPYGLAGADGTAEISLLHDASSLYAPAAAKEAIQLRDIHVVMRELGVEHIDLLKINIEGGEFPLLERMVKTGDIAKVKDIQVQFHAFVPHAKQRYAKLAKDLRKTHELTWRFPFVWENWKRRSTA